MADTRSSASATSRVELVKKIARMATRSENDRPFRPIKITHIDIQARGARPAAAKPAAPVAKPAAGTKPSAGSEKASATQQ